MINLAGLSLAIACCLILALYLRGELTYDLHHKNHERIYRIVNEFSTSGMTEAAAETSWVLAPMMAEEFDEIESFVTPIKSLSSLYRHEENAFYWNVYTANENIFEMFTHEIIYGNPETALLDGASLAVNESFAKQYFGDTNPIGEIVTNDVGNPLTITLVFADLPENTHLKYDAILSSNRPGATIPEDLSVRRSQLWQIGRTYSYLMMPPDFGPADFEQMAEDFYQRHMADLGARLDLSAHFWLEPLASIHYQSDLSYDEPGGNKAYLFALLAVGSFILFVACVNYVNLATARSVRQAKEVGMRKILGANIGSLRAQFIAEAILLAMIAMLLGLVIVEVSLALLPLNELFGKTLEFSLIEEPQMLGWLMGIALLIGLLTGLYPALYLSSWAPLSAMIGSSQTGNSLLRRALVLTQFVITVAVLACTLLMLSQIRYLSDRSLGFVKENRIVIEMIGRDLLRKMPVIEAELNQHPNILDSTTSGIWLGKPTPINVFSAEDENGQMKNVTSRFMTVDPDYLEVMEMEVIAGREFSGDSPTDPVGTYIVNQFFVESQGWLEPIGKRIALNENDRYQFEGRIIGVVRDFHFQSLHEPLAPFVMRLQDNDWENKAGRGFFDTRYMTVNITGENIRETIDYLEGRFREFDPKHPFQFQFLDESLEELYQSEQRMMQLVGLFAGICIFIACLGLFGLASFTTEQRSKEIGIRKVLGASAGQIIYLLSRSILSLVLIGAVVGCIAAYFAIDYWLGNFAYRADMTLLPYLIATITALFIAYTTVALQSYKTAQADPVDALRYE